MKRALFLAAFLATRVAAAPHLTIQTTASRDTIAPLETIGYTVVVRNDGDSAPSYLRIANRIPTSAMLVDAPEFTVTDNRELSWSGRIEPGASHTFNLTFVTRRDSAGLTLSNMTEAHYDGLYANAFHDLQIGSATAKNIAGWIVAGYVGLTATVLLIAKKKRAAWALILIAGGFLLIFADLAHRDLRMKREFVESRCTVLDSIAQFRETPSSKKRSGTYENAVAVRYGGQVSIAYPTASALAAKSPSNVARGALMPCWFDPRDPKTVVLSRDLGGAYGFALIPLAAIAFALFLLRR
ncbi:MAG TPA: DUF3592 domain-containing protein [Thermoanaerobaculia bacterium]